MIFKHNVFIYGANIGNPCDHSSEITKCVGYINRNSFKSSPPSGFVQARRQQKTRNVEIILLFTDNQYTVDINGTARNNNCKILGILIKFDRHSLRYVTDTACLSIL